MSIETESCVICKNCINTTNITVTECNHKFHFDCLHKWISISNTCPMCREVLIKNLEPIINDDDNDYENDFENEDLEEDEDLGSVIIPDNETLLQAIHDDDEQVVRHILFMNPVIDEYAALKAAVTEGHYHILDMLVKHIKNVDAYKNELFLLAVTNGFGQITQYLVEIGANVHYQDDFALRFAVKYHDLYFIKILIEHGANIHTHDNWVFKTAVSRTNVDLVKLLVAKGISINCCNNYLLRMSVICNNMELVKYFVENDKYKEYDSALQLAIQYAHVNIASYLVSQGADIKTCRDIEIKSHLIPEEIEDIKRFLKDKGVTSI